MMFFNQVKFLVVGVLMILLFSQLSFKSKRYKGQYRFSTHFGSIILNLKNFHNFDQFATQCNRAKRTGKWHVEEDNVILIYKNKYEMSPDTLKIKKINSEIYSLGEYKKL